MSRRPNKRLWAQKPDKPVPLNTRHWLYPYLKIVAFPGIGQYGNLVNDGFVFNTSVGSVDGINGNRVRRFNGTTNAVDRGTFNQSVNNGAGFITRIAPNVPINGSATRVGLTFNSLTCGVDHTVANPWQWSTHVKAGGSWAAVQYGQPPGVGEMATVAGVWNDAAQQLSSYQDGQLTGASSGLGNYDFSSRSAVTVGSGVDNSNNNFYWTQMDMDFLLYFEGIVPTDAQIESLSNNPWQLLQPRTVWIPTISGGIIIKTFADVGISSDGIAPITSLTAMSDLSQSIDIDSTPDAAIDLTDSAVGLDSLSQAALLSLLDTSIGNDGQQLAVSVALLDAASMVDSVALLTDIIKTFIDASTSNDALKNINASYAMADVGTGLDQLAASIAVELTDQSTANDTVSLLQEILKTFADIGAGADALSVAVSLPMTDSASGSDALLISALLKTIDSANGVDAVVNYNTATRIASIQFTLRQRSMKFTLH